MRLLPDSIRTRTILVLLIGLTASHLGSMVIYSTDRNQALAAANERSSADRVATLARLVESSPVPIRQQVAEAISSPTMRVWWGAENDFPPDHRDDEKFDAIHSALTPVFGTLDHHRLHVIVLPAVHPGAAHGHFGLPFLPEFSHELELQVSLCLTDGSWVNFQLHVPHPTAAWSADSLLSTLVMVVATLVLSIWATGWITAPLAAFTQAAERLGMDVNAPPLRENGPKEVRSATQAFNRMQQRVRSFVEDRLQMLAAISHDLRTPITRLRLRTEQLPIEPAQQGKMLADLDEMEQMVAASLDFARDEAIREPSKPMDLAALLETICDDLSDMGVNAEFAWTGRLIYRGRPLAMKRLFSNLIDNAVRYGHRAKVRADSQQTSIMVLVEDDGPGIPADKMEKVFMPFYRLEHSRNKRTGGLGLGLANVRTIARAHGGDVTLENRPEGGLRVIVVLPREEEDRTMREREPA